MGALVHPSVLVAALMGLVLIGRGKVRDAYELPGFTKLMLVYTRDNVSIFDHVLRALILGKGEHLVAMNIFWRLLLGEQFPHDLVAFGPAIDEYLPVHLRGNPELWKRCVIVKRLKMVPVELVVRAALTGNGLKDYLATGGLVNGHRLPAGLWEGKFLDTPIFTPTTKAAEGHDLALDVDDVGREYGPELERLSLTVFARGRTHLATRELEPIDTKFEVGYDADGNICIGDEVLTSDSSRIVRRLAWKEAQARSTPGMPASLDKQRIREWGKTEGIDKRDPLNPDDVAAVHALTVPEDVIADYRARTRWLFWALAGTKLENFQRTMMGVPDVRPPVVDIVVISGSTSDLPQMIRGLQHLEAAQSRGEATVTRHVMSCHRHEEELRTWVRSLPDTPRVIVAAAALAAALPGDLDSLLRACGIRNTRVIGVALKGKTPAQNRTARGSIVDLPGQPVILDPTGQAYYGLKGFHAACELAVQGEFLPQTWAKAPEPQLNAPLIPPEFRDRD